MPKYNPLKDYWAWAIYGPIILCVIMNAIVRPYLGRQLGGELISRGASVRGIDRWWVFDDATRGAHPWLTNFLTRSDGEMAMICFAMVAVLCASGWVVAKFKSLRR